MLFLSSSHSRRRIRRLNINIPQDSYQRLEFHESIILYSILSCTDCFFFFVCATKRFFVTIRTRLLWLDEKRKKNQPEPSKQMGKANTALIKLSEQRDEANAGWNWNKNQNLTSSYFVELSSRLYTRLDSEFNTSLFFRRRRQRKDMKSQCLNVSSSSSNLYESFKCPSASDFPWE